MATIRVDAEVRAALDAERDRHGDPNYSDAIRRVLKRRAMLLSKSATNDIPGVRRWL